MDETYIKLKIEKVINKILYEKNVIEKALYEETSKKIDQKISIEIKNMNKIIKKTNTKEKQSIDTL